MKMTPHIKSLVDGMQDLASGKVMCPCCGDPTEVLLVRMFGRNFKVSLDEESQAPQEDTSTPLLDALKEQRRNLNQDGILN
jgi:hypothetical protein